MYDYSLTVGKDRLRDVATNIKRFSLAVQKLMGSHDEVISKFHYLHAALNASRYLSVLSVVCGLWSVVGCSVRRLQPNTDGPRKLNIGVRIGHDKGKVHAKFDVKGSKFKIKAN